MNNYSTATDELFDKVLSVINSAEAVAIFGHQLEGRWQGNETNTKPDNSKVWYRVSRQTVSNPKTGFGNSESSRSRGKFTNYGILFVQLFIPKAPTELYQKTTKLAQMIVSRSFRNKTTQGRIVFRNPRIQELLPENDLNRINVVTEYEYDEIQ